MALQYWAYIFLSPGFDAEQHVTTMDSGSCRFKAIGISMNNKEQVIEIAKQLVSEGVQLIELCGGFGPQWMTKVSAAIKGVIPIGGVFYGPEARKPMLDILSKDIS
ncbi:MAG: putative cytosolic protein [uncultured bacterium]|nr:MAG: putative cytosolic protein [uncultured bacterium]OGT46098.1 MAG: hypothetical protein A3E83_08690 [Gammaproteobacteria bacterium RIFCSPHIGHO2_12_FULL_41_20]